MSTAERAREYRAQKKAGTYVRQPRTEWLPWPREAEDGTPLGVDLTVTAEDVRRIMLRHFRPPAGVDFEDYYQEVCTRIVRRNHMPSAHDPRKSSFGHYVYMVANATGADLAKSESKRDGELSLQGPCGALGAVGPTLEEVVQSKPADALEADAKLSLEYLVVRGAIGPTAKTFAMDCLTGAPITERRGRAQRDALMAEIVKATAEE